MPVVGRTALYRAFDVSDQLLYVGITDGIDVRFKAHQNSSEWWPLMVRREVEWFDTRREAIRAEASAISKELPIYNRMNHGPERKPHWLPRDLAAIVPAERIRKQIYRRRKAAERAQLDFEQAIRDGRAAGLSVANLSEVSGLSGPQVRKIVAAG